MKQNSLLFRYQTDEKELKEFIKNNLEKASAHVNQIVITKNNFTSVYFKWAKYVKPSIDVNWDILKKNEIIDADFYLADLLSDNGQTLKDALYVLLKTTHYELKKGKDELGLPTYSQVRFKDNQEAYMTFWNLYKRPPRKEYWDYIVKRRDLLVPQDIRERKGSFFTPQIWVEKSQEYLTKALGENWQDEYYIWDCCAGTGNLLNGLTNIHNIWASTIDKQDVDVMKDRIRNGANLLETHVFQMDFLNDDLLGKKVPPNLKKILKDPEKRKKLVIYINPPYAEATTAKTVTGTGKNKSKVATDNETYRKYKGIMGNASNEIYAQFFIRVAKELNGCVLGSFSTLKILQAQNFKKFREEFAFHLMDMFVVPSNTFDNVRGQFPIGFMIWDTSTKEKFSEAVADAFDRDGKILCQKKFYGNLQASINKWIKQFDLPKTVNIGYMENPTPDVQNNKFLCVINKEGTRHNNYLVLNEETLIPGCVYFSVRKCMSSTWLNDRDQFLWPKDGWEKDIKFCNDCLAFALLHGQNRITSSEGENHWIPYTEKEVNAQDNFDSHFMTDFMSGKLSTGRSPSPFVPNRPLVFSTEAKAVFAAGKALWIYYHKQKNANVNASFYDIREYFQGRSQTGKMNNDSDDETYNKLIAGLRGKLNDLAAKIAKKVYEYEFLKP